MDSAAQPTHSLFIVRIAHEPGPAGTGRWRGTVEHVPSGLRLCFASFKDLDDFISVRLNLASPPAPPEPIQPYPPASESYA